MKWFEFGKLIEFIILFKSDELNHLLFSCLFFLFYLYWWSILILIIRIRNNWIILEIEIINFDYFGIIIIF